MLKKEHLSSKGNVLTMIKEGSGIKGCLCGCELLANGPEQSLSVIES